MEIVDNEIMVNSNYLRNIYMNFESIVFIEVIELYFDEIDIFVIIVKE